MILNDIIEYHLKSVFNLEYLKECFELRISLINGNKASKTEFEKNEDELTVYKTKVALTSLDKKISEQKDEFNDILKIFFQQLEEERTKEDEAKDDSSMLDYK